MKNSAHFSPDFIDARRFEELFPFSQRTFFLWIQEGRLVAYRPSPRKTLVRGSDVEKLLEASRADFDLDKIVSETLAELEGNR